MISLTGMKALWEAAPPRRLGLDDVENGVFVVDTIDAYAAVEELVENGGVLILRSTIRAFEQGHRIEAVPEVYEMRYIASQGDILWH